MLSIAHRTLVAAHHQNQKKAISDIQDQHLSRIETLVNDLDTTSKGLLDSLESTHEFIRDFPVDGCNKNIWKNLDQTLSTESQLRMAGQGILKMFIDLRERLESSNFNQEHFLNHHTITNKADEFKQDFSNKLDGLNESTFHLSQRLEKIAYFLRYTTTKTARQPTLNSCIEKVESLALDSKTNNNFKLLKDKLAPFKSGLLPNELIALPDDKVGPTLDSETKIEHSEEKLNSHLTALANTTVKASKESLQRLKALGIRVGESTDYLAKCPESLETIRLQTFENELAVINSLTDAILTEALILDDSIAGSLLLSNEHKQQYMKERDECTAIVHDLLSSTIKAYEQVASNMTELNSQPGQEDQALITKISEVLHEQLDDLKGF